MQAVTSSSGGSVTALPRAAPLAVPAPAAERVLQPGGGELRGCWSHASPVRTRDGHSGHTEFVIPCLRWVHN